VSQVSGLIYRLCISYCPQIQNWGGGVTLPVYERWWYTLFKNAYLTQPRVRGSHLRRRGTPLALIYEIPKNQELSIKSSFRYM